MKGSIFVIDIEKVRIREQKWTNVGTRNGSIGSIEMLRWATRNFIICEPTTEVPKWEAAPHTTLATWPVLGLPWSPVPLALEAQNLDQMMLMLIVMTTTTTTILMDQYIARGRAEKDTGRNMNLVQQHWRLDKVEARRHPPLQILQSTWVDLLESIPWRNHRVVHAVSTVSHSFQGSWDSSVDQTSAARLLIVLIAGPRHCRRSCRRARAEKECGSQNPPPFTKYSVLGRYLVGTW